MSHQPIDQALCAGSSRWLGAVVRSATPLALLCALAALALLLHRQPWAWAVLVLLPLERLLALRLHFDSGLFKDLASPYARSDGLQTLDQVLAALRLRRTGTEKPETRSLVERVHGAMRLGRLYLAVVLLQAAVTATCVLTLQT